jgi:hypothetical protein
MDDEAARRIKQLEETALAHSSTLGDLQTIVLGPLPARDNGIRSDLKDLKKRFYEAVDEYKHKWDVERRETCIGRDAMDVHLAWHEKKDKEEEEVKAGTKTNNTAIMVVLISSLSSLVLGVLQLVARIAQ